MSYGIAKEWDLAAVEFRSTITNTVFYLSTSTSNRNAF